MEKYCNLNDVPINRSGFRISSDFPFLGCSPDGVLFDQHENIIKIIEIKCPYGFKDYTLEDIKGSKEFYMKYNDDTNDFTLKQSHIYFYQVQGILNIMNVAECDFVVYTPNNDLIIETIKKIQNFGRTICCLFLKTFGVI